MTHVRMMSIFTMLCTLACHAQEWTFAVRGAYVQPTSTHVRRIYGHGMPQVQLQASRSVGTPWNLWFNIAYAQHDGCSSLGHPSKIRLIPASIGLRWQRVFKKATLYLGGGPILTDVRIDDDNEFVTAHLHNAGFGFAAKSGMTFALSECTFVDFFLDYAHQRVRFIDATGFSLPVLNLSNVMIGIGLGMQF